MSVHLDERSPALIANGRCVVDLKLGTRTYAGDRLCLTDRGLKEVCAALLQYDLEISYESTDSRQRPLSTEMLNEAAIHVQLLLCLNGMGHRVGQLDFCACRIDLCNFVHIFPRVVRKVLICPSDRGNLYISVDKLWISISWEINPLYRYI